MVISSSLFSFIIIMIIIAVPPVVEDGSHSCSQVLLVIIIIIIITTEFTKPARKHLGPTCLPANHSSYCGCVCQDDFHEFTLVHCYSLEMNSLLYYYMPTTNSKPGFVLIRPDGRCYRSQLCFGRKILSSFYWKPLTRTRTCFSCRMTDVWHLR